MLGVFADGQFGSIRGSLSDPFNFVEGREKLRDTWAAGVRLGYLVAPNVYSYVNAGYTGSEWSGATLTSLAGGPIVATTPSFHRDGWFIGGGVENNLNIFGITAPGWFMKTEYRSAFFDRITLPETFVGGGLTGSAVTFKPWVQTISTSLVYRFYWNCCRWVWCGGFVTLSRSQSHLRADRHHRTRLSLQLGWPGRHEVLIFVQGSVIRKAPPSCGAFLCRGAPCQAASEKR